MACDTCDREGHSPSPRNAGWGGMFHGSATGRRRGATFADGPALRQAPTDVISGDGVSPGSCLGRAFLFAGRRMAKASRAHRLTAEAPIVPGKELRARGT